MTDKKDKDEQERGKGKDSEETQKDLDDILGQLKESDKAPQAEKKGISQEDSEKSPKSEKAHSDQPEPEGLEQILDSISEKEDLEPVEDISVVQRIVGVFTGPAQVFQYLRVKPDFIVPLILAILIGVTSGFVFYDIALDDQIATYEQNDRLSDEQRNLIIDGIEQSRTGIMRLLSPLVFAPLGIGFIYAVISLIFWFLGNVLLGGKARFKQVFSVFSYSYLIIILLESVIQYPLILSKQTLKIDMSPAVFLNTAELSQTLAKFISSFDIFHLWFLVVFGIGFSIIYGFSKLKGVVSVFIAWLLYVLIIKVALASLTQGLLGF
ncbi:MAG: YIP1 family protein [bacterium]|nr:MAG: YIP1 family protein [bacterium]